MQGQVEFFANVLILDKRNCETLELGTTRFLEDASEGPHKGKNQTIVVIIFKITLNFRLNLLKLIKIDLHFHLNRVAKNT